ncbi:MAG: fibronectin type III domain-containing protein [Anaerolineae bacterium]|nr:fibronectin type III domain-containing protein [Anaerolineae bacterium]
MKRVQKSVVGWLLVSMLLPLLAVLPGPGAVAQDPSPTLNLFVREGEASATPAEPDLGAFRDLAVGGGEIVRRSRAVLVDPNLLPTDPARATEWLTLNLFDDVVLDVARDGLESTGRGYVWWGHVEGVPLSQVILVVRGGRVTGNVVTPEAFYQVRHAGNGWHLVRQVDQSAFPPEAGPVPVDLTEPVDQPGMAAEMADDGSTIDVLVAYTPAARDYAGGALAIEDLINLAVAEGNTSYANSAITQRLRLVHAAEVSYTESGNIELDLGRLRHTGDSHMDAVHGWRNTYGADEVVLLVADGGGFCGISYMMDSVSSEFAAWAFAVVQLDCATGYYSFVHELGHNMGARHDWYVDGGVTPYTHAHGYVNPADRWRTVMAYDLECADAGYNCTRLPYWSNPDVWYGGDPMGIPEGTGIGCALGVPRPSCDADNRKTLNKTAYTVANFRQSVGAPPSAPTGLSATAISPNSIVLTWTDSSDDESGFEIERSPDGSGSWTWISSTGANVTAFTDTGAVVNTPYEYRVRAFNPFGASDYSPVVSATTSSGVGPLVFRGYRVDDDGTGSSSGDGDSVPECGETIDLFAKLENPGATARGVVATIGSTDPHVTWPGNVVGIYGDIASGGSAMNQQAFELALDPATPHGYSLLLTLDALASSGEAWSATFSSIIRCSSEPLRLVSLPFMARNHVEGLNAQFSGSADGWQASSGEWWIHSEDWYTTGGLAGAWATASYEETFADLDYETMLWRNGCENCAHGVLVRGTPWPLGTLNRWASGYGFYLTREGRFAVFDYGAGDPVALQNWTPTTAVHPGSEWNLVRVVASGSRLWFYVNGELVWMGEDDSHAAGQVGVALYRDADSAFNQLWVDWARLASPVRPPLDVTLGAAQRALNAASTDDSGGSDGVAP